VAVNKTRLVTVVAVLVVLGGCGGGRSGTAQGVAAERWVSVDQPSFALEHPRGWTVRADQGTGQVTVSGDAGEQAIIRPFFVAAPLDEQGASSVLTHLASKALPGLTWDKPDPLRNGVVRVEAVAEGAAAVAVLNVAASPKGTAGYLYVASAPRPSWPQSEGLLARVLESFLARGRAVEEARAPRHVRWEDPAEKAFSVEVPEGWRASGGTVRPSTVLVQAEVEATSPDGAVTVAMGDHYPVFVEPNAVLSFGGIEEGGTYVDPSGYPSPVRRYAPGSAFIEEYVLPERAPGFEVTADRDRADLAGRLATYGINRYDAGEVDYRFQREGQQYRGSALGITEVISAGGATTWHTWRVYLAEAPADRYEEARAALLHLAATFAIDPGWAQGQARLTAEQSRIIADMGEAVSDTISQGYEGRQAVLDELDRRRSNATLGVEDVVDEATGRPLKVKSGSDYYWIDPRGVVVGTETQTRPDLDFRELVRLG
jgi:hypothetical protein